MNDGDGLMIVNFPRKKQQVPVDWRMQQLILSILSGAGRHKLHVAPVACWMDRAGRIRPAHMLPEVA